MQAKKSKAKDEKRAALDNSQPVPNTAEEYNARGWGYRVQHQLDLAEADFREAMVLNPKLVHAVYGLAQSLMEQGKNKEAIEHFEEAAELLDSGALGDDPIRGGMLRRQALGHVERLTTGEWDLHSIGNAIPKG